MKKIPVAVLGATGSVGQKFITLLEGHPWFEIKSLIASERSQGKKYRDAVNWLSHTPIPSDIADMPILSPEIPTPVKVAFSGLDSSVAGEIEAAWAKNGVIVVSNSRNHRMDPVVPLLIPEINSDHLELLKLQPYGNGKIVTNPNCSVIGLALAIKPLHDLFGIEAIHVVTMQAISGAGYPGVASLDILDNVIPFINGEEAKIETELLKILGALKKDNVEYATIKISAHCNRVPVSDGHTECVSVKFSKKPTLDEIKHAWNNFKSEVQKLDLPLAPKQLIHYFEQVNFPQPKLHRHLDKSMAVSVGRLRECPLFDYKFTMLTHNTIRGAAGGAILNAELMYKKGLLSL